jgi:CDP-diacylglycerol--glycerol-3-phosphate 3-phosphatidyltransferase
MNLPNLITFARILMVPILVVVLMTRVSNYEIIGATLFWIASLTDLLDGYLARRYKQVTRLGKLLDPLADKLLVTGALLSLVELNLAPAWMVFIIIAREFTITGLRGIASEEGITIAAGALGKWKFGFQVAAISCLLFGPTLDSWMFQWTGMEIFRFFIHLNKPFSFFWGMGVLLLWGSVFLAIWSAVVYLRDFWKLMGDRIFDNQSRLNEEGRMPGTNSGEDGPP